MSRIAYVNGRFLPHVNAAVSIDDRGFLFADAVYEVCEVRDGEVIDSTLHLDRLERSLRELRIRMPMSRAALLVVMRQTIKRNRVRNGGIYIQISRGQSPRDHLFPNPEVPPTVVMTAKPHDRAKAEAQAAKGIAVITVPDNRWERVDIKSVGLLPNCLAKQAAKEAGAKEAWFVDAQGFVTEGSSTNAWIVTAARELVTRPAETGILRGITRTVLLKVADKLGLRVVERAFTVDEAKAATEAFITAATTLVMPVVSIDGSPVGDGHPGETAPALRRAFHDSAEHLPV
ncbi:MAG: D-amino-acid transaminase [Phyllobacteriaceae bacterium]|nr:D-amino-acid transaminase [Phyllobacteriaceae bacterium]